MQLMPANIPATAALVAILRKFGNLTSNFRLRRLCGGVAHVIWIFISQPLARVFPYYTNTQTTAQAASLRPQQAKSLARSFAACKLARPVDGFQ